MILNLSLFFSAIEKLEVEAVQQQNNNTALNQHLMRLRNVLVQSFALITIPGSGETPTIDNIDFYMQKLQQKLIKEKVFKEVFTFSKFNTRKLIN